MIIQSFNVCLHVVEPIEKIAFRNLDTSKPPVTYTHSTTPSLTQSNSNSVTEKSVTQSTSHSSSQLIRPSLIESACKYKIVGEWTECNENKVRHRMKRLKTGSPFSCTFEIKEEKSCFRKNGKGTLLPTNLRVFFCRLWWRPRVTQQEQLTKGLPKDPSKGLPNAFRPAILVESVVRIVQVVCLDHWSVDCFSWQ